MDLEIDFIESQDFIESVINTIILSLDSGSSDTDENLENSSKLEIALSDGLIIILAAITR